MCQHTIRSNRQHHTRTTLFRVFVFALFIAMTTAPLYGWWNKNFFERIAITVSETNGVARTNEATVLDVGTIVPLLTDTSGSDIRLVDSDDNTQIPVKILRQSGKAAYALFRLSISAGTSKSLYLYYNYSQTTEDTIPSANLGDLALVNDTLPSETPTYMKAIRIAVYGKYDDYSFLSGLGFAYTNVTDVPETISNYDVVIDNHGTNFTFSSSELRAYSNFVNRGGGVFIGDSRNRDYGGAGKPATNFYNLEGSVFAINPLPADVGILVAGDITVLSTNHYITRTLDANEYLGRGLEDYGAGGIDGHTTIHGIATNLTGMGSNTVLGGGDLIESPKTCFWARDLATSPSHYNGTNGRYVYFPVGKFDTDLFAVKTVMVRGLAWLAKYDEIVPVTSSFNVSNVQYNTFIRTVSVDDASLTGKRIVATLYYVTNMYPTTPVISLSNATSGTVPLTIAAVEWENDMTCAFTATAPSTLATGKYYLVVEGASMNAKYVSYNGADYVMDGIAYSPTVETEKVPYRFIPEVFAPAATRASLTISLSAPRTVSVVIYAANGTKAKTLLYNETVNLTRIIRWDGTSDAGVAVSKGLYIAKIEIEGEGVHYARIRVAR